jgi:WD40 repeat protein
MSATTGKTADLFSRALISSYVEDDPRFVERPWLVELVEEKLALPKCRFVLLTGEPGSGKTALLAWLAQRSPDWLRYFIRRDSQVPLNSGDARSFLFALGHQLAALRPGLFHPEKLEIVVRQRVGEIERGGRTVGIQVGDLEVSPFYETAIRVEQQAGTVAGDLTGITAGRLVAEERFLEVANLQFLALLDPAEVLLREEPDARIVILVDALDELRYHSRGESALDWLAACPQLPANVRFLLTSRPDERLLELFRRRQGPWLHEEAIDADPREVEADLTRYASRFARDPDVAEALVVHEISAEQFIAHAVARADRNFQYLAALFRALEHMLGETVGSGEESERRRRVARLLRLEEVPVGLGELYGFFLSLIRDAVADERVEVLTAALGERVWLPAWEGLYQPVLGVLAVAREPLRPQQIAHLGAIDASERWLYGALARLAQFLHREDGRSRLYHASFAEYLTAPATRDTHPGDYLDPGEWHGKIAATASGACGGDWLSCQDPYALDHTPAHLVAAVRGTHGPRKQQFVDALAELLSDLGFLEARVAGPEDNAAARPGQRVGGPVDFPSSHVRGVDSVLDDLRVAAEAASPNQRLGEVLRVLDLEAHNLRRRQPGGRGYFLQQLHNRAVELGASFLREPAAERLARLGEPYLDLRWRASAESPALERTLTRQQDGGTPVVVDGSAGRLVSVSADHAVMVSDVASGREIHALTGHRRFVRAVALAPDRRRVVSGGDDGTVRVWDLETGREVRTIAAHKERVASLAITPDGQRVVSGSLDNTAKIWNLDDGRLLHTLPHRDPVGTIASAVDGRLVVTSPLYSASLYHPGSTQKERSLRVWDVESGRLVRALRPRKVVDVRSIAVTPDGRRVLASCSEFGASTLRIWEVETGKQRFVLQMPIYSWVTRQAQPVAVTPDGTRAICASWEDTLVVWDLASGRQLHNLAGHEGEVLALAVTPDSQRLLSASADRRVRTWDLDAGRELQVLAGHADAVTGLAVVGRERAVSASRDGVVKIWQLKRGSATTSRQGHRSTVRAVALDRGLGVAVSGSDDGTAKAWDVRRGSQLCEFSGGVITFEQMDLVVSQVLVSPDGRRVASASNHGIVKVWDVQRDKEIYVLSGDVEQEGGYPYPVNAAALTPDGRRLVAAWGSDYGTKVRIHTLETADEEFAVLARGWSPLRVADAADIAVWRAKSEALEVWDLSAQKRLRTLANSEDAEGPIAISAASGLVVGGFGGIGIGVWELATGRAVRFLPEGVQPSPKSWLADKKPYFVTTVGVSPNGEKALSASTDGLIRVWDLTTGREEVTFGDPEHRFPACAADTSFRRIVGIGADASLAVFDLERKLQLASIYLEATVTALAVSHDATTIFAGDRAGSVYCFRTVRC